MLFVASYYNDVNKSIENINIHRYNKLTVLLINVVCSIFDLYDYFDLNSAILLVSFDSSIGLLITFTIQTFHT